MITDQDKEEILSYFKKELIKKYGNDYYLVDILDPEDFLQKALYRLQIDQYKVLLSIDPEKVIKSFPQFIKEGI